MTSVSSCKKETQLDRLATIGVEHFSIKKYIYDQWKNYDGHPLTLIKSVNANGKCDTTYTNSEKMDWSELFFLFFATDISNPKYIGRYKITRIDDQQDGTENVLFEAIDDGFFSFEDDLFTRRLLVTVNPATNAIIAIYIETLSHGLFGTTYQKLYYSPFRTIRIQENKELYIGKKSNKIIQYNIR